MPGIGEVRSSLLEHVAKPLGNDDHNGPYPYNVRNAIDSADKSNELAQRLQDRFERAQALVGKIIAASEATLGQLKPANDEQAQARNIAGIVFAGTRNADAQTAQRLMNTLGQDTPPLLDDTTELNAQSKELSAALGALGEQVEKAVNDSTIDVERAVMPLWHGAHQAAMDTIEYVKGV